jgi:hypothetical protein
MKKYLFIVLSILPFAAMAGLNDQDQHQLQGQSSWNSNANHNGNYNSNKANAYSGARSSANAGAVNLTDTSNAVKTKTEVSISDDSSYSYKESAHSAYAPSFGVNNNCVGAISAGGQGLGFGFSVGGTVIDHDCVRRLDADFMATRLNDVEAARELLCQKADIRKAYAAIGKPCKYNPHVFVEEVNAKSSKVSIPDLGF